MSSEIQRRTDRTLMFKVLAIAESVDPVISNDTSICRRGSWSAENEVMIGTEASQTASKSHCRASTSSAWRTIEARSSWPGL